MKLLVWLLLVGAMLWVGRQLHDAWLRAKASQKQGSSETQSSSPQPGKPATAVPTGPLPGLPELMEASLQEAQSRGAVPLKQWLDKNRRLIADPRLAAIELDYVVMIGTQNRGEARRVLGELAARLAPSSPVYGRFKKLQESFQ